MCQFSRLQFPDTQKVHSVYLGSKMYIYIDIDIDKDIDRYFFLLNLLQLKFDLHLWVWPKTIAEQFGPLRVKPQCILIHQRLVIYIDSHDCL